MLNLHTASIHLSAVLVVGTGGTGSLVAEGLCRFLPKDVELALIDPDRIEEKNLVRQNFFRPELGQFKAEALAERLARNYGRAVKYSVESYGPNMEWRGDRYAYDRQQLIIGCVDNAVARQAINLSTNEKTWWLDSGNAFNTGQVLIGNMCRAENLEKCLANVLVSRLPNPALQVPGLLLPETIKAPTCADAFAEPEQSPVINQAMATLVLDFVWKILNNKLEWMGAYIDLNYGSLQPVVITSDNISQVTQLPKLKLHGRKKTEKGEL
jgi:PRTRC genetic system ThiF family protein